MLLMSTNYKHFHQEYIHQDSESTQEFFLSDLLETLNLVDVTD